MPDHVVIVGAGIIGAATAYYLSLQDAKPKITIIEACTVASSASGKAGGFLALNWCDGSDLGQLARKSFELHAELSKKIPFIGTGYRQMSAHGLCIKRSGKPKRTTAPASNGGIELDFGLPYWVTNDDIEQQRLLGSEKSTAQVHPDRLTRVFIEEAKKRGATVRERTQFVGIEVDETTKTLKGVKVRPAPTTTAATAATSDDHDQHLSSESIPADALVLALGAWSTFLGDIIPCDLIQFDWKKIFSCKKSHSILIADPARRTTPDALFLSYDDIPRGKSLQPEIYPRGDGTVYVCGISSIESPPLFADQIEPKQEAIATLKEVAAAVSKYFEQSAILKKQACFLPCSEDGLPVLGALPGLQGVYVATGHGCWGILNAPATGAAMAELIMHGEAKIVDLKAFDPMRFCKNNVK